MNATDRILPHNIDIERAVLGACLLGDLDAIDRVATILQSEQFYHTHNRKIYNAILNVTESGTPVDEITVTDELTRMGELEEVGGPYGVVSLKREMATTANVEYHAEIVRERYVRRHLITQTEQIQARCYDETEDVAEIAGAAAGICDGIEAPARDAWETLADISDRVGDRIDEAYAAGGEILGVTSGLSGLDRLTAGFQRQDLILVAARPSIGKTALGLHIAVSAAGSVPVGFVSAEMGNEAIGLRILSMLSGVDSHRLRLGRVREDEWGAITQARERMSTMPIHASDCITEAGQIVIEARKLKRAHDIGLLITDYIQLIEPQRGRKFDNREREVASIGTAHKRLAKELNIPVVALCQLNRNVEGRSDKRPGLSDLRESGALEQDADIVLFLYPPGKYGEKDEDGMLMPHTLCEVIVGKQRNGPVGTVQAFFDPTLGRWGDWYDGRED